MKFLNRITLIHWLLIVTFLKQVVFAAIIPLWHGPDEQAHFAQTQFYAEHKHGFTGNETTTTSQEVVVSEQLLGTYRDHMGKNKFTHNPNYRLEYTNSIIGKYELVIRNLPISSRLNLVKKESTNYPPLFYIINTFLYLLIYPLNLIDRVFFLRFSSAVMVTLIVWFTYKLAQLIFPRQQLLSFTAAILVSFQPMLSFLGSSVNSDNLMNLVFTIFIYLCARLIYEDTLRINNLIFLALVVIAGFLTKPHFIIVVPILLILPLFLGKQLRHALKTNLPMVITLALACLGLLFFRFGNIFINLIKGQPVGIPEVNLLFISHPNYPISFWQHLVWTIRHTIAEIIPWYWGVFNWLGVTLPRGVNRVINRLLILSALGIGCWLVKYRQFKNWSQSEKIMAFIFLNAVIFFVTLMTWDWIFVRQYSFSFGIQGRYYFPTISAHLILILIGLTSLIPKALTQIKTWTIKIIGIAMIALNFIGLDTLTKAYYQLWPLKTFLFQVSQYKPIYFKFPWILFWFTLYIASLCILLVKYLKYANPQRSRS